MFQTTYHFCVIFLQAWYFQPFDLGSIVLSFLSRDAIPEQAGCTSLFAEVLQAKRFPMKKMTSVA